MDQSPLSQVLLARVAEGGSPDMLWRPLGLVAAVRTTPGRLRAVTVSCHPFWEETFHETSNQIELEPRSKPRSCLTVEVTQVVVPACASGFNITGSDPRDWEWSSYRGTEWTLVPGTGFDLSATYTFRLTSDPAPVAVGIVVSSSEIHVQLPRPSDIGFGFELYAVAENGVWWCLPGIVVGFN